MSPSGHLAGGVVSLLRALPAHVAPPQEPFANWRFYPVSSLFSGRGEEGARLTWCSRKAFCISSKVVENSPMKSCFPRES